MVQQDGHESKWTTVTVTREMRDTLKSLKRGGESYTDLFERMLDQYEEPAPGEVTAQSGG